MRWTGCVDERQRHQPLLGGRMNCLCCLKPFGGNRTVLSPAGYCDVICYAAASLLTASALKLWRESCWKLDVSPTRPIT